MKTLANLALLFASTAALLVVLGFVARFYWELMAYGWNLL